MVVRSSDSEAVTHDLSWHHPTRLIRGVPHHSQVAISSLVLQSKAKALLPVHGRANRASFVPIDSAIIRRLSFHHASFEGRRAILDIELLLIATAMLKGLDYVGTCSQITGLGDLWVHTELVEENVLDANLTTFMLQSILQGSHSSLVVVRPQSLVVLEVCISCVVVRLLLIGK